MTAEPDSKKSAKKEKPVNRLALWLWRAGVFLAASLPLRLQYFLGRLIGRIMLFLLRYRRKVAAINIARCLPSLSGNAQKTLLRRHFEACGIGLFECANAWHKKDVAYTICGLDELLQRQKNGHGVLLLCGHFSSLELAAALLAREVRVAMIYREFSNHLINRLFTGYRQQVSIKQINRHRPRKIIEALRRGKIVILAWDQYSGASRSVFSEFFGHPVSTPTFPMWLARFVSPSNIFFATYYRENEGSHYLMEVTSMMRPCLFSASMRKEDIRQSAQQLNHFLEKAILYAPEQYLWMHSRFKRQPEGLPPVYPPKN